MKLVYFRSLFFITAIIVLSACTTTGNQALKNETQQSIATKFQKGVSTKGEIISALGAPTETSFTSGGLEILRYEFARFTPKARNFIPYNFISVGSDGKKKELVVLLDENSLVKKLVMNESDIETLSGMAE